MKLLLKRIVYYTITLFIVSISFNTYALDQMAKEETTPPPAEGALTTEQLIPQWSTDKNKKTTQQVLKTESDE